MITADHLYKQKNWSLTTFGPGLRTKGLIDHISKELIEIENDPQDINEWVDVLILAFDGAWRAGFLPEETIAAFLAKQEKNYLRDWPDWTQYSEDEAIEHIR